MMHKGLAIIVLVLLAVFPAPATGSTAAQMEVDSYCYDMLNVYEQLAYQAIEDCVTHMIASWNSGSFSQNTIQKAYNCFLMDHPEVFWTDGYTYVTSYVNNTISGHRVEFNYTMTVAEVLAANSVIEQALIDMILSLPGTDNSYETVKAVYDWFIANCSYDELNLDQSMYSVMVDHSGVCASFSKSFQFIMQCLGFPCTVVYGDISNPGLLGSNLGHEWDIVRIGDFWYHVDITSGISRSKDARDIDYSFLCATTEEILKTHTISNPVEIPQCDSQDLNYYNYFNLNVDTYSREAVLEAFQNSLSAGRSPVARFSSYRVLCDAVDDLITNHGIFSVIRSLYGKDVTSVDYYVDDENMTFSFSLN